MRQIFTLLISIILISSCSEVRFSQPQPQNGREIDEFPKMFVGRYLGSEGDTLIVTPHCFHFADDEIKKLCSDRVVLKKKGKLHIVSCREVLMAGEQMQRKGWEVLPFELVKDTLFVYFLNTTNEDNSKVTITALEGILDVEEVFNVDGDLEYYYIDPSIKEFERILNSECFSIAEKFVRLD